MSGPTVEAFKAAYALKLKERRLRDWGTGRGYDPVGGLVGPGVDLEAALKEYRARAVQAGRDPAEYFPTKEEIESDGCSFDLKTPERMLESLKAGRASFSGNAALKAVAVSFGLKTSGAFHDWLKGVDL